MIMPLDSHTATKMMPEAMLRARENSTAAIEYLVAAMKDPECEPPERVSAAIAILEAAGLLSSTNQEF